MDLLDLIRVRGSVVRRVLHEFPQWPWVFHDGLDSFPVIIA